MIRAIYAIYDRSIIVRLTSAFAAAAAALALIGLLVTGEHRSIESFDNALRTAATQAASPFLTSFLRAVTRLGSTMVLTIVGAAATAAFLIWRQWRAAGLFLLAMVGQIILHHGFKAIFERERPEALLGYLVGDSYSFPSGHALASLSVYFAVAGLITVRARSSVFKIAIWTLAVLLVFLIGFSRIYFGVHHATDVLAGYLGALIWTAAVVNEDRRHAGVLTPAAAS